MPTRTFENDDFQLGLEVVLGATHQGRPRRSSAL